MKYILLFGGFFLFTLSVFGQKRNANDLPVVTSTEGRKPVDITILVNGSTIRISGTVRINMLTSTIVFEGNITVVGNGGSVQIPVNYNGPLKKGPYQQPFNRGELNDEEYEIAEWVGSRLMIRGSSASFNDQHYFQEESTEQ